MEGFFFPVAIDLLRQQREKKYDKRRKKNQKFLWIKPLNSINLVSFIINF